MRVIEVVMPDGSIWAVPTRVIAGLRAQYYSGSPVEFEYGLANETELLDWALGNVDWEDIARFAAQVSPAPTLTAEDLHKGWASGRLRLSERPFGELDDVAPSARESDDDPPEDICPWCKATSDACQCNISDFLDGEIPGDRS